MMTLGANYFCNPMCNYPEIRHEIQSEIPEIRAIPET